jgi:hypothetical protein
MAGIVDAVGLAIVKKPVNPRFEGGYSLNVIIRIKFCLIIDGSILDKSCGSTRIQGAKD